MTTTIAITGKSGSGKTTITKAFLNVLKEKFPEKSILLFDNDLSGELGHTFGMDIRNTIYGIRSGKHEYRTGIPENMSKQEFVEWAMEDIIMPIEDNIDIIVSWLVGSKDCRCPITSLLNDSIQKILDRYDFVIFDCEFDLKYLDLAKRINEYSAKYAAGGQFGVILNKATNDNVQDVYSLAKSLDMEILGAIPYDKNLAIGSEDRESELAKEAIKNLYFRLNLPQENA